MSDKDAVVIILCVVVTISLFATAAALFASALVVAA